LDLPGLGAYPRNHGTCNPLPDGQVANPFRKDLLRIFDGLSGVEQTLTIVHHAEVGACTLHAIYRQALRFIPESGLHPKFYSE